MKTYSATEIIVMMERIEAKHFNDWWGRLKEQLEELEAAEQSTQRIGLNVCAMCGTPDYNHHTEMGHKFVPVSR